jgi:hypothetical protein
MEAIAEKNLKLTMFRVGYGILLAVFTVEPPLQMSIGFWEEE